MLWTFLKIWFTIYAVIIGYSLASSVLGLSLSLRRVYVRLLLFLFKKISLWIVDKTEKQEEPEEEVSDEEDYIPPPSRIPRNRSFRTLKHEFKLIDAADFITSGAEAIVDDDVTKRFTTSELHTWNLLTRTKSDLAVVGKAVGGWKVFTVWMLSIIVRYSIFLFLRLPIAITSFIWLAVTMFAFKLAPPFKGRKAVERYTVIGCSRLIALAFSAVINHHDSKNKARCGGICVANHTTPMDVAMLATNSAFTMVGQRQGGFFGILEKCISMGQNHIWFERSEAADRHRVAKRLKEHVQDTENNPILIFPEGTCINNTGVFMFKKGCFELGATIYPAAMKYNRMFSDPYWNSAEQNLLTYIIMLMTSWAVVCDIYYLEPTEIRENETSIEFASRVKADICRKGGLVDLDW
jgi:glycerol-3-phosphate O-acyltransferase 3/4